MKRILIIGGVVLALVVVGLVVVPLLLVNSIVKAGFEAAGPRVAKVTTRLDSVNLSLFSGEGQLKGLFVGNPQGYKSSYALQVGEVSVALEPRSLFSDKVVVRRVNVAGPGITFEGGLQGNNLNQIMANVHAFTGSAASTPGGSAEGAGKKLQVDDFAVTGGTVTLTTGAASAQSLSLALPDIRFSGLGAGPDGITGAELTERVLNEIIAKVTPLVAANLGRLAQDALSEKAAGLLGNDASNKVDAITRGVGDLLKKKK